MLSHLKRKLRRQGTCQMHNKLKIEEQFPIIFAGNVEKYFSNPLTPRAD